MVTKRPIGPLAVKPIGLGCMGLSCGYGRPRAEPEALALLERAIALVVDSFDTETFADARASG